MSERKIRKLSGLLLCAAMSATLFGCAGRAADSPLPKAKFTAEEIVGADRFAAIASDTEKKIAAADSAGDGEKARGRACESFLAVRGAHYRLKKLLVDGYKIPSAGISPKSVPVVSGTDFPRTMAAVARPAGNRNFSTLSMWKQDSARADYKLCGQTFLFPGLRIPRLKTALTDRKQAENRDSKYYAADAKDVLGAYAQYLNDGKQGKIKFAPHDRVFTEITEQRSALKQAVGNLAEVNTLTSPGSKDYMAVPTENGGLVMLGELSYSIEVTRKAEGATLRLGDQIGALAAGAANQVADVKNKLSANYLMFVSFYIPPAKTGQPVQVVGAASPVLNSVTNGQ